MCVPLDEELIGTLAEMHLEAVEYLELRHRALHDCLERLRACDRDLICSRYGHDVSARDIAIAQGRSLKGVYRSLARIRGALLDCIARKVKQEGGL
jgi:RNA polymerase sigma-70 factor (ECF subfamily)